MSSNKEKPKEKLGIRIPKRQPGKVQQTNYLQNLRPFPSPQSHPVDDLIGPSSANEELDTQQENILHPADKNTGHPASGLTRHSDIEILDTQQAKNITSSIEPTGHPTSKKPGAQTPKVKVDAPSREAEPGAQAPGENTAGHSRKQNWRQWDKARSTVRVNLHIDKEVNKKVRQYCLVDANPKVELKEFYERAAVMLLGVLDTQQAAGSGAQTPFDDRRMMIISKTKAPIINLYLTYNSILNPKTKWTVRDDDAGSRLNDVDLRIIELGILQTQSQKNFKGKVHAFSYYVPEIENLKEIEINSETLDVMIKLNRSSWERATGKTLDLSFLEKGSEDKS